MLGGNVIYSPRESKASNAAGYGVDDEDSPLIQELLARSKENKAKYDKERLDDYNRRNFKEYFDFVVSGPTPAGGPTETQQKMKAWLETNK
eukprot:CAMPEP_0114251030 /NCGR_PEP_ID=MMETSP0058-20121206/15041_1 /TAXON_ID=36894 /ORGANISM="Pyramimonas parkeae, CCMP726" /LENGTH=90 /DNA_ID=CAMNT_0001364781 /DNA_START=231 /DNA_END=503 /DNA_ORIENTATION=+